MSTPPDPGETLRSPAGIDEKSRTSAGVCLSVDEALAFSKGLLDKARLATLEDHLRDCEACERMVHEAMRPADSTGAIASSGAMLATFRPGTVVGRRYRIERFVARGGMGEVYRAYDLELHDDVALKTVIATASDAESAVRSLKREVQHARRVSHPNVCRIFDFGTHIDEISGAVIYYLTMEFVEGETLGKRLRRDGPLPLPETLPIVRQILAGLAAAHRAGVLHRDLKSENVILRDVDGRRVPVILDFGLARALDREFASLTSSSNFMLAGTLGYMAPEQMEGKALGPRSDLYSLGVMWFEMLTGKLPFDSSSPALSALERLQHSAPDPSSLNPELPKELDAVFRRCLARHPEDRFGSASELLAGLDRLDEAGGQSDVALPSRRSSLPAVSKSAPARAPAPPLGVRLAVALGAGVLSMLIILGVSRSLSPSAVTPVSPLKPAALSMAPAVAPTLRATPAAAAEPAVPFPTAHESPTPRASAEPARVTRASAPRAASVGRKEVDTAKPRPSNVAPSSSEFVPPREPPAPRMRKLDWVNPFSGPTTAP